MAITMFPQQSIRLPARHIGCVNLYRSERKLFSDLSTEGQDALEHFYQSAQTPAGKAFSGIDTTAPDMVNIGPFTADIHKGKLRCLGQPGYAQGPDGRKTFRPQGTARCEDV